jgi:hypothetical protein
VDLLTLIVCIQNVPPKHIFLLGVPEFFLTNCFCNSGYVEVDQQRVLFFFRDSNPLYFFISGGWVKSDVLQDGSEVIRTKRGISQRARRSLFRRATSYVKDQVGHWEFSCSR